MGYSQILVMVYGTVLDAEQTEKVHKYCLEKKLIDDDTCLEDVLVKEEDLRDGCRYRGSVWSHDTDARCASLEFELDGRSHTFGIFVGDDTGDDDLIAIVKNGAPDKAKENWDKYCQPVLDELELDVDAPQLLLVKQVW